jgi:hypothetical protein
MPGQHGSGCHALRIRRFHGCFEGNAAGAHGQDAIFPSNGCALRYFPAAGIDRSLAELAGNAACLADFPWHKPFSGVLALSRIFPWKPTALRVMKLKRPNSGSAACGASSSIGDKVPIFITLPAASSDKLVIIPAISLRQPTCASLGCRLRPHPLLKDFSGLWAKALCRPPSQAPRKWAGPARKWDARAYGLKACVYCWETSEISCSSGIVPKTGFAASLLHIWL